MVVDYARIESMLNALWCETLRVPQVAATDNFIDLGGNSLAAMRIASRVKDSCGIDVPMSVILGDGTLRELSDALFKLIEASAGPGGDDVHATHGHADGEHLEHRKSGE